MTDDRREGFPPYKHGQVYEARESIMYGLLLKLVEAERALQIIELTVDEM